MQSAPGTRFSYNQTNYALLARILDKQAGMPFAKFFAKRQFEPAGMKTTCLGDTLDVLPGGATPYSFLRRVRGAGEKTLTTLSRWTDDLPAFMRTAAGINSTAEEVAHWIIALQGGKLLSKPDSLKTLWSADTFTNGKANEWAMGWPIMRASPPHPIVGGLGGGRSAFFVYPDDDLAIVVLTNLVGSNPHTFMDDIAGFYLHRKGA
jgi:CubicO group peptidase (beta-lactamase class C family)